MTVPRWLIIGGLAGLAWTFVSLVVGFTLGAVFKAQERTARHVQLLHDYADLVGQHDALLDEHAHCPPPAVHAIGQRLSERGVMN